MCRGVLVEYVTPTRELDAWGNPVRYDDDFDPEDEYDDVDVEIEGEEEAAEYRERTWERDTEWGGGDDDHGRERAEDGAERAADRVRMWEQASPAEWGDFDEERAEEAADRAAERARTWEQASASETGFAVCC